MTPESSLKLVRGVRDLQIIDSEGRHCGIVDNIEFQGRPGEALHMHVLLVGPGAYAGRLPKWLLKVMGLFIGTGMVRIPWDRVKRVTHVVELSVSSESLGLARAENKARAYIPRIPAL